jgi:phosphoribosylanthranilate isomerase
MAAGVAQSKVRSKPARPAALKPRVAAAIPRVKICGITSLEDALRAVEAGADALGFNFYPGSPRCLSLAKAAGIIAKLPPLVATVSVWVNPTEAQVRESLGACRWSALQFSGDEDDALLLSFPSDLLIRAVRLRRRRDLAALRLRPRNAAWLVDAAVKGAWGGTGVTARWDLAAELAKSSTVILAGGLNKDNVAEAVRRVRPYGVDTASGVERAPGRKDFELMRAFVRAAKQAGETQ